MAIHGKVVARLGAWILCGGLLTSSSVLADRNLIDRWVSTKLDEAGLEGAKAASRPVLIRRLAFDLTGLPPSGVLYREHATGDAPPPLETVISSMLNSPAFGERMASMWMNVARYAEDQAHQVGSDVKHFYPNAYLYRQWVIDAFNQDLGYDQFIKLQLAADLYDATPASDIPALGFLGLGPKYYNRGRLDVMADEWEDRVDTVTRGFLGLTVACARCHDHKFDPIPTEDYYALAGVFASTKMVNAPFGKPAEAITEEEKKKGLFTVHIVEEGKPQDLPVFIRGNVDRKGDVVPRRFLQYFYSDGEEPPGFGEGSGRRELADVIASPENPLTAKVYVNRIWQVFFGRGIVGTPSNFGALGEAPSHPELLDELARAFVEQGWSTKWLVREIVSSATYQQDSALIPANAEVDPENRLLWRMPRRRLSVEMWRDSLLTFADNVDQRAGRSLELDDPANHRRTLYGRVSRKKLNPLLMHHDYPDPNVHSARRAETTTPLQKLFSLNSEFVLEQSKRLAGWLDQRTESDQDWIRQAYQRVFFRSADETEMELGLAFLAAGPSDAERRRVQYAQALLTANEVRYLD